MPLLGSVAHALGGAVERLATDVERDLGIRLYVSHPLARRVGRRQIDGVAVDHEPDGHLIWLAALATPMRQTAGGATRDRRQSIGERWLRGHDVSRRARDGTGRSPTPPSTGLRREP